MPSRKPKGKSSLSREEFWTMPGKWKRKIRGIILQSKLKKPGCSLDWDRTSFTDDKTITTEVIKVFIALYNKGVIYRGKV